MSKILQSQRYWCNFFRQGHLTMVVLLLGCGADPTLRDGQGEFMIIIYCTCISGIFHDHLKFSLSHWKNTIRRNYIGDCLVLETFQIAKKWLLQIKNITPFLQIVWHEKKNTSDYTLEYIHFIHCYSCL